MSDDRAEIERLQGLLEQSQVEHELLHTRTAVTIEPKVEDVAREGARQVVRLRAVVEKLGVRRDRWRERAEAAERDVLALRQECERWQKAFHQERKEVEDARKRIADLERVYSDRGWALREKDERLKVAFVDAVRAEAEREIALREAALLGDPSTREGKAMRALVRAAASHIKDVTPVDAGRAAIWTEHDGLHMRCDELLAEWRWEELAACLALLLARREQDHEQRRCSNTSCFVHDGEECARGKRRREDCTFWCKQEAVPAPADEQPCRACGGVGSVPRTLPDQGRHPCGLCFHKKDVTEPERRTCGACKHCGEIGPFEPPSKLRYCLPHPRGASVYPHLAPLDDCPGFEPRD